MRSILRTLQTLALLTIAISGGALVTGCTSTPKLDHTDKDFASIVNYKLSLPDEHSHRADSIFYLGDNVRNMVRANFKSSSKHRSASKLARWLMRPDGHNMQYDIEANLTPSQAFSEGRANCLSFSLLLIELAAELDIELELNQVDLPDIWGEDELEDLVFYRHVNVVYKTPRHTQIFDLALEEYRPGFPQRIINKEHGVALLFSNIGVQELQAGNMSAAFHYLKLSVSMFPENADMWINLGAAFKRVGNIEMAEKIYLNAYSISDQNSLASSNLERIYRNRGNVSRANYFGKRALGARLRNPYMQYRLAQKAFDDREYRIANKAIKRAIRLHDADPKFYELRSRIRQLKNNYVAALKDLHKAYLLTQNSLQKGRYAHKADMVVARAKAYADEKNTQRDRRNSQQEVDIQVYRGLRGSF